MDHPSPTPSPSSLPLPLPHLPSSSFNPQRDIWTNLCISTLLDEYEKAFIKLGRGHLRPKDWETLSLEVNRRTDGSRTAEQCKCKIESLKKHYRRERLKCSNCPSRVSRWLFYDKVRQLVGDPLPPGDRMAAGVADNSCNDGDKRPVAQPENGVNDWNMAAVDKMEFRRKLCEKMGLDKLELQARMTDRFDNGQLTARADEREVLVNGRNLHGAYKPPNSQVFRDNVKPATVDPPGTVHKKSPQAAAEAIDPPKSQADKATKKCSTKNREIASLGKDLKEGLSNFAAVIERIERTKMELTVHLQRQRLEQDNYHAEMEVERTRLLMKSQLDLAKLICASTRKDCIDGEDDERCRKKGRWEVAFDVGNCRSKDGEKNAEVMTTEGGQRVEHKIRMGNSGDFNHQAGAESETPSSALRRDESQFHIEDQSIRVNGTLTGSQDFRDGGFQCRSQNWSRNESVDDGTENIKEDVSEENEIRQRNQPTHWETGTNILPRRECDDLNCSISNHRSVDGSRIEL